MVPDCMVVLQVVWTDVKDSFSYLFGEEILDEMLDGGNNTLLAQVAPTQKDYPSSLQFDPSGRRTGLCGTACMVALSCVLARMVAQIQAIADTRITTHYRMRDPKRVQGKKQKWAGGDDPNSSPCPGTCAYTCACVYTCVYTHDYTHAQGREYLRTFLQLGSGYAEIASLQMSMDAFERC